MAEPNYSDTVTATYITGWIFGSFDPSVEYRSKPGDEDVVQRRKKAQYTRYRLLAGPVVYTASEGKIANASDIESSNGTFEAISTQGRPTGSERWICSEDRLDNEGGQGSGMWRQTQVWEAFAAWYDWTSIESDLGVTNPFT